MKPKPKYKLMVYQFDDTVGKEYQTSAKSREEAKKAMEWRLSRAGFEYGGSVDILELNESGEYVVIDGMQVII